MVSTQTFALPIVGPILDMQRDCYAPLRAADTDNSKSISPTEYISFVQSFSDDPIFDVTIFRNLPIELVEAHNTIVTRTWCDIMQPSQDMNQCLAEPREIIISGIPPQNDNDLEFLYNTCASTQVAVYEAQGYVPSDPPSLAPSPTTDDDVNVKDDDVLNPNMRRIEVPFGIASKSGLTAPNYNAQALKPLYSAMNDLAQYVSDALLLQGRRLGGLVHRNMEVVNVENGISTIRSQECPPFILSEYPDAECSIMTGYIDVEINGNDSNNIVAISNDIYTNAQRSIPQPYQEYIDNANGTDYVAYNVTKGSEASRSFPLSAILGIAAGAVLIGLCAGRQYAVTRRNRTKPIPESDSESVEFESPFEESETAKLENGASVGVSNFAMENASVDSSNAGSSGWSSSAGLSSLNTGVSVESDAAEHSLLNSSLAAIGAASNILHKPTDNNAMFPIQTEDDSSQSDHSVKSAQDAPPRNTPSPTASRKQLESAIDAGDWAAVGATAALLANDAKSVTSGDSSVSSNVSKLSSGASSGISNHLSVVSFSSKEKSRAAELDRLVEAGDWEGVVLTAAKFEAEKDDKTEGSASNSSRKDRSIGNLSNNSPSVSTNISDSLSSNLKRAELRAEVESLVRRVVPDEIDNVDEMMVQFRGREEELVETLRTMQERSIAARQREASRRNAKREAKKLAKASKKDAKLAKLDSEKQPLVKADDEAADDNNVSPDHEALQAAIDANDWEAVGKTAEQIAQSSDHDSSSVQSSDFDSVAEDDSEAYLSADSGFEKVAKIEGLIKKNDWSGVVAAASAFNKAEKAKEEAEKTNADSSVSTKGTAEREEAEARAQAHMWANIAEQSKKVEGSTAIGASDAADWAISRSLKQIQDSSAKDQPEIQSAEGNNEEDNYSV